MKRVIRYDAYIPVRIENSLKKKIELSAKKQKTTVTELIRRLIDSHQDIFENN